ncbi:MAG: hypothetical protein ACR2QJ_01430, partial [Geminicoccaceae bacterium]
MASLPSARPTPRAEWYVQGLRHVQEAPVWPHVLLFVLGTVWGLQFTLLKIATDSGLDEAGILALSMGLIAAAFLAATA